MREASAGNSAGKILLNLYCECKLVRNEIILKDPSIAKNPQNKNKILILFKHQVNGTESISVRIINSKNKEEFCGFKVSEIQEVYPQMVSIGKMTIITKAGLKVLLSNAPPELLKKVVPFVAAAPPRTVKEEVKEKTGKDPVKSMNPRVAALLARKRQYQELKARIAKDYKQADVENVDKRHKIKSDPHIMSLVCLKSSAIKTLPYDILGLVAEYIYDDILTLSLISKDFNKVCNTKFSTLALRSKHLPVEYFVALLSRFSHLKVLKLSVSSIKVSDLKHFPVELHYLQTLDLRSMTSLTDGVLQRIMEKTKKLARLRLPMFAQLTGNSLAVCASSCQALETFELTSGTHREKRECRIANESIVKFVLMVESAKRVCGNYLIAKPMVKLELYYLNRSVAEVIVKNWGKLRDVKFAFVDSDGCLGLLSRLKELRKISVCAFCDCDKSIVDDFMACLEGLKEDSLEKIEVGEFANTQLINYIGNKFGNTLKILKVHSMRIHNADIDYISTAFKELESLDTSGCVVTEESVEYMERLELKKLVVEIERFFVYNYRQELIAKFPNTAVKVKYKGEFLQ
eukprot:TRINITY_DN15599_c0_g1_i21.p1 TRINITY_DN15599_c0_g1~~TRINITY_DN15599_c0_g1_i21.p1  ORF type:complete len:574 (-),score=110.13 TRINITY_DN15599_c0_g1_i21:51-1772(-)